MSFTFAELKTAIQDYSENTETTFVNNLSIFIENAEQRIFESVQLEFFSEKRYSEPDCQQSIPWQCQMTIWPHILCLSHHPVPKAFC